MVEVIMRVEVIKMMMEVELVEMIVMLKSSGFNDQMFTSAHREYLVLNSKNLVTLYRREKRMMVRM